MAEVEIHTGHHDHSGDKVSQSVGVAVGIIGILLAVVTIGSHRAHTSAVIARTEANDQWSFYQAKKIREQVLRVGAELARAVGSDPARVEPVAARFAEDGARYATETRKIEEEAQAKEKETHREEARALRLDLGEGFLELGLVLSSLYFLSKRRFFPVLGGAAALIGIVLGIIGFAI
ncbi:MAG TPA: DUF4337 domain-containing protein [Steroidobacteraceae bacterium]|nr:DUF4337 domain-containing protein [Steroidobacteraceae bacterium]